ncbi:MAG: hypothetical protein ABI696_07195 [Rubrivivax sp.]
MAVIPSFDQAPNDAAPDPRRRVTNPHPADSAARSIAAEALSAPDHEAVAALGQPLHAGAGAIGGAQRFVNPVALELDAAVGARYPGEAAGPVQVVHRHAVHAAPAVDLQEAALDPGPAPEPGVGGRRQGATPEQAVTSSASDNS